jgi:hypothetical protein
MRLNTNIMPSEVISMAYLRNPTLSYYQHYSFSNCWCNTLNITWIPELLLWNLVRKCHANWGHLNGIHHKSFLLVYQHCSLSDCRGNNINSTWISDQSSWNLVGISFRPKPSKRCTSWLTPISNKNTKVVRIVLFYWLHYAYILKFSVHFTY